MGTPTTLPRSFRLALPLALAAAACAAERKLAFTPSELRAEVARRAPAARSGEVVIPFEVTPAQVARARNAVALAHGPVERGQALTRALFDPAVFGLRYAWGVTAPASATLDAREGNCLSLASVYVGLARALGLPAHYIDASSKVRETRFGVDGMVVSAGHLTAMVGLGRSAVALDFDGSGTIQWYRVLSDLEALAHYYNNRGYDLIAHAEEDGVPVDWAEVARQFELAVAIAPELGRAWNNLGLAYARLGRDAEAAQAYRTAIAQAPDLAAAHNNLGLLELQAGAPRQAAAALEEAARLDPQAAHVQLNLAQALVQLGDRPGAVAALHRAVKLRTGYDEAESLLRELEGAVPWMSPERRAR